MALVFMWQQVHLRKESRCKWPGRAMEKLRMGGGETGVGVVQGVHVIAIEYPGYGLFQEKRQRRHSEEPNGLGNL